MIDHNPFMVEGFAEFFKSGYIGNLINSWIPAVDNGNVLEKLQKGAKVANVEASYPTAFLHFYQCCMSRRYL
jgi:hypothetical protein